VVCREGELKIMNYKLKIEGEKKLNIFSGFRVSILSLCLYGYNNF